MEGIAVTCCPKCGKGPSFGLVSGEGPTKASIGCHPCKLSPNEWGIYESVIDAIEAWNMFCKHEKAKEEPSSGSQMMKVHALVDLLKDAILLSQRSEHANPLSDQAYSRQIRTIDGHLRRVFGLKY